MTTTEIERPSARHHDTRHHDIRPDRDTQTLIRQSPQGTLPRAGDWIVGRGHRVTIGRLGLRRRTIEAVVVDGVLTIGDDPIEASLDLILQLPGGEAVRVAPAAVLLIDVGYHGVFAGRGRTPTIWLEVRAVLEPSAVPQRSSRRPLELHTHLMLHRVRSPSAGDRVRALVPTRWRLFA